MDDGRGPLTATVVEVEVLVCIKETDECGAAFARSSLMTCRTSSNNWSNSNSDTRVWAAGFPATAVAVEVVVVVVAVVAVELLCVEDAEEPALLVAYGREPERCEALFLARDLPRGITTVKYRDTRS